MGNIQISFQSVFSWVSNISYCNLIQTLLLNSMNAILTLSSPMIMSLTILRMILRRAFQFGYVAMFVTSSHVLPDEWTTNVESIVEIHGVGTTHECSRCLPVGTGCHWFIVAFPAWWFNSGYWGLRLLQIHRMNWNIMLCGIDFYYLRLLTIT